MRILITGATSGIGKQLALDYHEEGHEVWAIGRNEQQLGLLAERGLRTARLDLTEREKSLGWFATLESLDLAILNAGTCEYVDLPHFDSDLFVRVMRTNVESVAVTLEGVLPCLQKGTDPHLVGIGSSAAYLPLPRAEAYGASKAAISYLFETLHITLAPFGIAISLVCPGFVKTPLTDRNTFSMPFLMNVDEACKAIRRGIARKDKEIHFPKRFTLPMKLLSILPRALWHPIAKRMVVQ